MPARTVRLVVLAFLASLALAPAVGAAPLGQITEYSAGLNAGSRPEGGVTAGADGNLWFVDAGTTPAVGRVTTGGQITEFSSGLGAKSFPDSGIALGPDGAVWFSDDGCVVGGPTCAIGRMTTAGHGTEYPPGANAVPVGIATGPDANLWYTVGAYCAGHCSIDRMTTSAQITPFATGLNQSDQPWDIAQGHDGNLWFTEQGTPAIGRITPQGQITLFSAGLNAHSIPSGIAAGQDGNVWFTDQGTTPAIGRISPSGQITEFPTGLANSAPDYIAAGPDGNLWFTDHGARVIGRINFAGQITSYATGLNPGTYPVGIWPGADGSMWFSDDGTTPAVGRVGTGVGPAAQGPPTVSGAARQGQNETCGNAKWTLFAGDSPLFSLYGFDGFRWLRDGSAIPGAIYSIYTPTAADVGHQLTCQVTGTYPVPFLVTASATSGAVKIAPAAKLSNLRARAQTLTGRLVGGHCRPITKANRHDRSCRRALLLRIRFGLDAASPVSFTLAHLLPGRRSGRRCVAPNHHNAHHRHCTRAINLPRHLTRAKGAGANLVLWTGPPLPAGTYRLTATPAAGQPKAATFTVPH